MSFKWADFLVLAEALFADPNNPGPEEAAYRSAASRAYYAAHKSAIDLGTRETYVLKNSGADHMGIIKYFRQHSVNTRIRQKIATDLNRLRQNRSKADYKPVCPGNDPRRLAQASVAIGRNVLNRLDSL